MSAFADALVIICVPLFEFFCDSRGVEPAPSWMSVLKRMIRTREKIVIKMIKNLFTELDLFTPIITVKLISGVCVVGLLFY